LLPGSGIVIVGSRVENGLRLSQASLGGRAMIL